MSVLREEGKYTVNEIEERTETPSTTLRQWERRYGFPKPMRSESGYRLYSDFDLKAILKMKRYIADGVPASRAAELVQSVADEPQEPRPLNQLSKELCDALLNFDDSKADTILSEAHALHTVELVLTEVLQPTLVHIGTLWHEGKIRIANEHFASNYIRGHLHNLLKLTAGLRDATMVLVTCAPNEQHEIAVLMLAVMLRRAGYGVYYIGANLPIEDMVMLINKHQPTAVMISSSVPESLEELIEAKELLKSIRSLLIFGGHSFEQNPTLAEELGGLYLEGNATDAIDSFHKLVRKGVLNTWSDKNNQA